MYPVQNELTSVAWPFSLPATLAKSYPAGKAGVPTSSYSTSFPDRLRLVTISFSVLGVAKAAPLREPRLSLGTQQMDLR